MVKFNIDLKKWWTISLVLYIICNAAFSYGTLKMLNTYALYFFLGVSIINILCRRSIKFNAAAASVILYLVLLLIGMLYTPTAANKVERELYDYITMAVLVFCVVQYIDTVRDVNIIMFSYMLAGLALAIYVYAQYGNEFWILMQEATDYRPGYVDRLGSDLANANTIGMYTAISALIALYYILFDRKSKLRTVVCVPIMVFCFIVAMAAASKKGVLVLALALVCFWLYSALGDPNILKQFRNLLIMVGGIVLLFWMINTLPIFSGIAARFETLLKSLQGGQGSTSEVSRSEYIDKGIAVWLDNVLFGAGTASSTYHLGVYSHNNFVEILMNTGIVGFLIFYGVYPVNGYLYLRNATSYKIQSKLPILLFALLVSITVCSIGMVYFYDRYYMILFAVIFSAIKTFNTKELAEL